MRIACSIAAFLLLTGCQSTSIVGESETVWKHLAERYDSDGDSVVTLAEYGRETAKFQRMDRDEDGSLTEADFAAAPAMKPGQMDAMWNGGVTQRVMMDEFQDDDDPKTLHAEEVTGTFYRLDGDRDGQMSQEEYPGAVTTWGSFVAACDADEDGVVSLSEAESFFNRRDRDKDGIWKRSGGSGARAGVAEGKPAPDFTLSPPDGGDAVTLSSFRGVKPVALIFGSYT